MNDAGEIARDDVESLGKLYRKIGVVLILNSWMLLPMSSSYLCQYIRDDTSLWVVV